MEAEVSHSWRTVRAWGPATEPQVRRRHRDQNCVRDDCREGSGHACSNPAVWGTAIRVAN